MGNVNNPPAALPLLRPDQLQAIQKQAPQPAPQPVNPVLGTTSISTLLTPDQLRQQVDSIPNPSAQPSYSIYDTAPPQQGLAGMASELQGLLKTADTQLLSLYAVAPQTDAQGNVLKDAQGNTAYTINGQSVSQAQLQQHLLPQAGILHQQIEHTKSVLNQQYQSFVQTAQSQFAQMSPAEQQAVHLQVKAIEAIYSDFMNRINQVDKLIQ